MSFSLDVMCTLRVATVVLLCAVSQDVLALEPPPTAAQLREWAAGPCVAAGKHAGIDYAYSLDRAIAKDPHVWPRFFASPTQVGSMALQRRVTVPSCSVCYNAGATDPSLASYARRRGRFAKQSSMPSPPSRIFSQLSSR
jgi:hypothetical protein